jgi:hypothetical protein
VRMPTVRYEAGCVYFNRHGMRVWDLLLYGTLLIALVSAFASRVEVQELKHTVLRNHTTIAKIEHAKRGPAGPAGKRGVPGKDGHDGAPGKDGRPGRDGNDGKPGRAGHDGRNGRDGKDGVPGPQGLPGVPGQPPSVQQIVNAVCAQTPVC